MNKTQLVGYLERMDAALRQETELVIYGGAAFILLGEEERTSLDIDVAAPYSRADFADLRQAARQAGLPINPDLAETGEHLEWISALRLCLPPPQPDTALLLWRGTKLTVKTVSPEELVASKLIRYDAIDQADVQFLCARRAPDWDLIEKAVRSLPAPFHRDPVVRQNLANLRRDLAVWRGGLA
jgi:hypothetical protein